ncbi:MAG TPA: type III secretion system export apparatus subunit SctU [Usitatibacter sp.]|nr:type III secretion system export apparatus subunit SctU [Usitatibacter sp.]
MSEKTEQPTAKKLREAREEGNVAKSKDFTQTVLIVAIFGYIVGNGRGIVQDFTDMILIAANSTTLPFADGVRVAGGAILRKGAEMMVPFLLIVLVLGVFAELLQTGIVLAFKALKPSAKKLNMLENAKQWFSKKNLVEFVKSLLKIAFLSALIYVLIRGNLDAMMKVPLGGVAGVGEAVGALLGQMIIYTALTYAVISFFDLGFQRWEHTKQLMMSKDEVTREYKEMEGDPHVKSHRKALAQEIALGDGVEKTRKASVVVTNPTHLAVAVYYEEGDTPLPVVLFKGENLVAERMVKAAQEAGVPVMQNIPLARSLFEAAQLDQYVPAELLEPVAEVLRVVRALRDKEAK